MIQEDALLSMLLSVTSFNAPSATESDMLLLTHPVATPGAETTNPTVTAGNNNNSHGKSHKRPANDRIPQLRTSATKIGLKMLPLQTEASCGRKGARFSMVLAGCRGTGKSTFLNTLIGESLEDGSLPHIDGQVRSRRFQLVENKFDMDLTVVDMPDFAAKIDNHYTWLPIVKYVEYQFRQYLVQEEQPAREQIKDNRVHVCIYFISPTNTELSTLDVESMKEIAKRVSLIPVIARSDTLNKDELSNFKNIINRTLADNEIEVGKYLVESNVTEKLKSHSPYAIIGSNAMYKNSDGKLVRARKYGWGMVEVENPEHCDFVHIRELLMSENMLDLITAMEQHYNAFRSEFLRSRIRSLRKSGDDTDLAATNEDGIASYKLYSLLLSRESQYHLEKYSGEEEALQKEARLHLEPFRASEEHRLRDWKKRIATVQATHNADLEESMGKVKALEKAILNLNPNENENLRDIAERSAIGNHVKPSDEDSIVAPSFAVV